MSNGLKGDTRYSDHNFVKNDPYKIMLFDSYANQICANDAQNVWI